MRVVGSAREMDTSTPAGPRRGKHRGFFRRGTRVAGSRTHLPGPAVRASRRSTPSGESRCARRARLGCGRATRQCQTARGKTVRSFLTSQRPAHHRFPRIFRGRFFTASTRAARSATRELPRGGGRRDVGPERPARRRRARHGGAAVRALAERRGPDVLGRARAPQARHLRPERRPGRRGCAVRVRDARVGFLPRAAGRARVRAVVGDRRRRARVRPPAHARLAGERQHVRALQGVRPRLYAQRGGRQSVARRRVRRRAARPERAQRVFGLGVRGFEKLAVLVLVLLPSAQARNGRGTGRAAFAESRSRRRATRVVAGRAPPRRRRVRRVRVGDAGAVREGRFDP